MLAGVGGCTVVFVACLADVVITGWWWHGPALSWAGIVARVVMVCAVAGALVGVLGAVEDRWLRVGGGSPPAQGWFWVIVAVVCAVVGVVPVAVRVAYVHGCWSSEAAGGSTSAAGVRWGGSVAVRCAAGGLLAGVLAEVACWAVLGRVPRALGWLTSWQGYPGRAGLVGGAPVMLGLICWACGWAGQAWLRSPERR